MSLLPVGIGNAGGEYTLENSLRFRQSAGAYLTRPQSSGNRTTWTWSAWVKLGYLNNDQWLFGGYLNNSNFTGVTINSGAGIQLYQKDAGSTTFLVREAPIRRDYSSWYHFVIAYDSTEATNTDRIRFYTNGEQITTYASTTWPDASRNSFLNYNSATANIGRSLTTGNAQFDGYQTEINFIDGQALDPTSFGEFDGTTGVWKPKEYTGTYGTNGFYLPTTATTQAEGFNTVLYTGTATTNTAISDVGFAPDLVWLKGRTTAYNHRLYDTVRGAGVSLISDSTNADGFLSGLDSFQPDGFTLGTSIGLNNTSNNYVGWCWDAGANQATTGISSVAYYGTGLARQVTGFGFSPDLVWIKARNYASGHALFDTIRGPLQYLGTEATTAESTLANSLTSFDSDGFTLGSQTGVNRSGYEFVAWGWDAGDGDPVTNTEGDVTTTVKANNATGFSIATGTTISSYSNFPFTIGHGLSTTPAVVIYRSRSSGGQNWWLWHKDLPNAATGRALNINQTLGEISGAYFGDGIVDPVTSTTVAASGLALINDDFVMYSFAEVSGVSSFGTYTGTGATGKVITTGFRPGFLMIKRTDGVGNWVIVDATRDPFTSYMENQIYPNLTSGDYVDGQKYKFTDTGFEFLAGGSDVNGSGSTYIYMAFKGSYSDYVSPLNTDGDIDSRVKANTEKGFSIVSYEGNATAGATVGHGLTSAPEMVIVKRRDSTGDWLVWNETIASSNSSNVLFLNDTSGAYSNSSNFNSTAPTSSVFTVGSNPATNASGGTYVAYCFHSVAGYGDIGTYTGTGSSGNSVTTGFRPAFVMIKCSSAAGTNWLMFDDTRDPDGVLELELNANNSNQEYDNNRNITLTDTGFEVDGSNSNVNGSGQTYIYMAFADTRDAQFNFDASGNKNNWTPNNINSNASSEPSYDIMTDVPTLTDEYTGNYCTWNSVVKTPVYNGTVTISNGNLETVDGGTTYGLHAVGTFPMSSGKWYWEIKATSIGGSYGGVGIVNTAYPFGLNHVGYAYWNAGYHKVNATDAFSGPGSTAYGATWTTGDVIGIALDLDTGTLTYYKNGVSQGVSATGVTGTYVPAVGDGQNSTIYKFNANFGQQPFAYTPPTGFLPLNTYNLPDATIVDGSEYMNTVLYTGDGTTSRSITGVGFQPDFVWGKERNGVAHHTLVDAVRGLSTGGRLSSNRTNAEDNLSNATLDSFDSDGFTTGSSTNIFNTSGRTFAAWNWKANGSGVSNTDGTASNVTVSANTTAGFSVVTYTGSPGDTVGHGLGVAPKMIIQKDRDNSVLWRVFHYLMSGSEDYNPTDNLHLNTTNAYPPGVGAATRINGVNATTFTNTGGYTASDQLAYCFASVEGFSAFGSYTGNGSADGPFVYTGFRPAWLLVKRTDAAYSWYIHDAKRNTYNVLDKELYPDLTNAEVTATRLDFTSNGFKVRGTQVSQNASGGTYIYSAFAENPFKNSLAR